MKDPEIISVKGPQSQPTNSDKRILPPDPQENASFEKKLKTSEKKLEQTDDMLLGLMNMMAEMSSAGANLKLTDTKISGSDIFSGKIPAGGSTSDIENGLKINASAESAQTRDQNSPSGNQGSPVAAVSKADPQQALLAQLLAYFKSTGVPFPVMDLVSKLGDLSAKPDIDLIAQKIVENASLIKINGKTELVLNLKPQWLGDLKMSISSDNGILTINLFANGKTKELIESQLEELKKLLAGSHLNVGSLNVSVGNQNSGSDSSRENYIKDENSGYQQAVFIRPTPSSSDGMSADADDIAMTMKRLMIYSEI